MIYAFTKTFSDGKNSTPIDFYEDKIFNSESTLYIKRTALGKALNYACPVRSTSSLHAKHKEQLEINNHSIKIKIYNPNHPAGGYVGTIMYDAIAVNIFCNISKQPLNSWFLKWVMKWL